jgi:hypothetical protein
MGEREDYLRRRREAYERMRQAGRRLGPLTRWRARRNLRRLVAARSFGPPGGWTGGDDGDTGGAGVREPRRPLPRSPQGAADLPRS